MEKLIISFVLSLGCSLIFAPLIIKFAKKMKASQTILQYVKEHSQKQGTPTMGGLIFMLPLLLVGILLLGKDSTLALITIASTFAFGIIGFLDDFIKIRYKQNLGLKPYQKIIGQVGISIILAVFVYNFIGGEIFLPFTLTKINLGFWIIPIVVFIYLATVNSVNLIDGLDGLSSGVSAQYLLGVVVYLLLFAQEMGFEGLKLAEIENLILICSVLLGSLIGFSLFNCFPAKIFMGDTGSLALGGFLASVMIFSQNPLLITTFGIMFVVTALSDIIQVLIYKLKKKRVFKMAPLHHHFQMCGVHENRIVVIYIVITVIFSLLTLFLTAVL